jgi:hypothetical protein
MNRVALYVLTLVACIGATDAGATYVIKLKNGNEYVTARYWSAGSQVFFDTYGGVFGVEKAFVNKIERTDQMVRLPTVSDRPPSEQPQADSKRESGDEKTKEDATPKKEKAPDDPIVGDLNRLKEKSKEVDGMLTGEIRELLNQITAFKNKLTKDSKLFMEYGRELNDTQELASQVETALRSRTQ